jgi:hypothetical protein
MRVRSKPRLRGTKKDRRLVLSLSAQGFSLLEVSHRARLHQKAVRRIIEHQRYERRQKNNHQKEH